MNRFLKNIFLFLFVLFSFAINSASAYGSELCCGGNLTISNQKNEETFLSNKENNIQSIIIENFSKRQNKTLFLHNGFSILKKVSLLNLYTKEKISSYSFYFPKKITKLENEIYIHAP